MPWHDRDPDGQAIEIPINPLSRIDNSHLVTFRQFCTLLEKVSEAPKHDAKFKRIEAFVTRWQSETKGTMYPALRLLIPNVDKERSYNMKEVMLGRSYLEVLGIPKDSEDGHALLKFNLPGKASKATGDFPGVLYDVVRTRSTVLQSKVSIKEVSVFALVPFYNLFIEGYRKINEMLDHFARDHDKAEQRPIIRKWVETLTPVEHLWLAKIILKQMKLGVSEHTVLDAFHPDARERFTVNTNLKTLCEELYDPSIRLQNTNIVVGVPFKPQLSKIGTYSTLTHLDEWMSQVRCNECWIETKLDGERMQIHVDNGKWKYFSRAINPAVKRCILDGELVVYDPTIDALSPFGHLKTVGRKNFNPQNDLEAHPFFVAFDILQMDDVSLVDKPLYRRYEVLQSLVESIPGRIAIIDQVRVSTAKEAIKAFHTAIEVGQEGIIVKNPGSHYVPAARSADWTKIKAEYVEGVAEHPDVVVVGGYFGTGSRANKISHFLVAIRQSVQPGEVADLQRPRLLTFARVGSGASYKELDTLTQRFPWRVFDPKRLPSWLLIGKEKPEMIIDPFSNGLDNVIVLELKAAEITPTEDYSAGFTLRFPRIIKRISEIWDMDTVRKYREEYHGMLAMSGYRGGEHNEGRGQKRKRQDGMILRSRKAQGAIKVGDGFQRADMTGVQVIQEEPLKGKELCVLRSGDDAKKQDLERMAHALGAKVVQNPGISTCFVITDDGKTAKVANQIKVGSSDIINSDWLFEIFMSKEFSSPKWKQYIFMTDGTRKNLLETHDKYGDPYTRDMTGQDLFEYINSVDVSEQLKVWRELDDAEGRELIDDGRLVYRPRKIKRLIKEINERYFPEQPVVAWFNFPGALDADPLVNVSGHPNLTENERDRMQEQARESSGQPVEKLYYNVTHVIVDSKNLSGLAKIKEVMLNRLPVTFRIVTQEWILDSAAKGYWVLEEDYFPL
ncbi:DNA ligase (ATP) [Gonapodya sp. JEL0774]|nr:DNA ligase (ATP) [Gonapodya sp. JEL0774]